MRISGKTQPTRKTNQLQKGGNQARLALLRDLAVQNLQLPPSFLGDNARLPEEEAGVKAAAGRRRSGGAYQGGGGLLVSPVSFRVEGSRRLEGGIGS